MSTRSVSTWWIAVIVIVVVVAVVVSVVVLTTNSNVPVPVLDFVGFAGHDVIVIRDSDMTLTTTEPSFVFVDNTSTLSQGTYEHPYATLLLAQSNSVPGDVIYVFPGDDTTTGMRRGIGLQNEQQFLGSGVTHLVSTNLGTVNVPALSASWPVITNTLTDGDAVNVTEDNVVRGFTISDAMGNGIVGVNCGNVHIASCTILGSMLDHVHLEYDTMVSAAKVIELDWVTLEQGQDNGLVIWASDVGQLLQCSVTHCDIMDITVRALDLEFAGASSVWLADNFFDHSSASSLFVFDDRATLQVYDCSVTGSTIVSGHPFIIECWTNTCSIDMRRNVFDANDCGALNFVCNDTSLTHIVLVDNTLTNNGGGSIGGFGSAIWVNPRASVHSRLLMDLSDNVISNNGHSAVFFNQGGFDDLTVTAVSNTMDNNGGSGVAIAVDCLRFSLVATDNAVVGNQDNAISTQQTIDIARMVLTDNRLDDTGNASNAMAISHDGTSLYFEAVGNSMSGNEGTGLLFYAPTQMSSMAAVINGNTIQDNLNQSSNASAGIDIEQFGSLCLQMSDNVFSATGDPSVYVSSMAVADPIACMRMTGNDNGTTYFIQSQGSTPFDLAPLDVESVNTGTFTLNNVTVVSSCVC